MFYLRSVAHANDPALIELEGAAMEIGFIGLGKMGMNMVSRLQRDSDRVGVDERWASLITQA